MNKRSLTITPTELFFILVSCIVGMSITSLPADVASISKQDGWISTIIGGIYPLYIVLIGVIIIKKYPESNIMNLSRAFLGKIIGNVFNLLFMLQFFIYTVFVASGASNELRAYSMYFAPHFKVITIIVLIALYISMKGLKVIARFTSITFILICLVAFTSVMTFKSASILNIKPIFGAGVLKILEGGLPPAYSYANMELLLVIYPYVNGKEHIVKTALISTFVIVGFYTWIVFTSIYFSGPDLVVKELWPFAFVAESFRIPVVRNFRFIDMIIWSVIGFKSLAIELYAAAEIFNNISKINRKTICIFLALAIYIISLFLGNEIVRRYYSSKIVPWITIFNISYVTLISILAFIKDKDTLIKEKGEQCINEKI
jgi:spore germination protein (amino acid permease)